MKLGNICKVEVLIVNTTTGRAMGRFDLILALHPLVLKNHLSKIWYKTTSLWSQTLVGMSMDTIIRNILFARENHELTEEDPDEEAHHCLIC